ncbi:DUF2254 domain-containing protein [Lutibaculum baratangense]|uniref:DUF2254 domain-containing protein n=1 Tax=Lutibaculum baratangense AMV1 TaxID=631454 RepID=V4RKK3_9HYPH|nr:DUF2254 domain-containing protein [Lutibaculum baratangense]ESR25854.1 hypothetical protein N177_1189 [Lutibaculum baratangense AMV1]
MSRRRRRFTGARARIANLVDRIRESYWFWPAALSLAAVSTAFVAAYLDATGDYDALARLGLAETVGADSARAVLTTVATAMLSVAGVSFSILVAAFVFASGQFGPRILSNFMRDRANQVVLGIFSSTFLYCVLVLRLVGEDSVPGLSVLIALASAVACVMALLFFFHHAPESIRLMRIVSDTGNQLLKEIAGLFPEDTQEQEDAPDRERAAEAAQGEPLPVPSPVNGYVRFVDHGYLLDLARDEDLVIRLDRRSGDYVVKGRPLAWVWPAGRADEAIPEEICGCFSIGTNRTPAQDVEFLFELLMDVASRALSPGINDPRTAMICLDWITSGLSRALRGKPRPAVRCDAEGRPRLILRARGFQHLLEHAFGRLRPYFQRDPAAALHMMARIGGLVLDSRDRKNTDLLMKMARDLLDGAEQEVALEVDRRKIRERFEIISQAARGELSMFEARGRHPWL